MRDVFGHKISPVDTPASYHTPQRPGQPGCNQERPGPSRQSAHPTGPAPPFDPEEEEPPQVELQQGPTAGTAETLPAKVRDKG